LEGFASDKIDGLFGHDAAVLGLDVFYLRCDLLENVGIERSLHDVSLLFAGCKVNNSVSD
jgi:hypothetical protein